MDKAKENYSIGKLRTVSADELEKIYMSSVPSRSRHFICLDCGEYVTFVRRYKYKSYFKHSNSNDTTRFCELRSQQGQSLSIYERVGLPLYLKKENSRFELNLGFYSLYENLLKLSNDREFKITIEGLSGYKKEEVSFYINYVNFSEVSTSLKRIDFLSERYKLKYSSPVAEKLIKEVWGTNIEGVSSNGGLFSYGENGGIKIRINEEINTNTDYFYLCKNINDLSRYKCVNYEYCSNILFKFGFSNIDYSIYKVNFKPRNNQEFDSIYNFCRNKFKVSLLYKPSTLVPMWPPVIQKDNGISYIDNKDEKLFVLQTDEINPTVFIHKNTLVSEFKGEKLPNNKYLISIPFKKERVAVNINEKYSTVFISLNYYKDSIKTFSNKIYIKDNDENVISNGIYSELPNKKVIKVTSNSKCHILHYRKNKFYMNYPIKSEKDIVIKNITFGDEIIACSSLQYNSILRYVKNNVHPSASFEDELVFKKLCKIGGTFIPPPIWVKKLLNLLKSDSKTFLLLKQFLVTNKMPAGAKSVLRDLYEKMKVGVVYGE
jgi:hypothetical protein